jgi:hypothetical protein
MRSRSCRFERPRISDIVEAILYLEGAGFVTGEILPSTAARVPAIDATARA